MAKELLLPCEVGNAVVSKQLFFLHAVKESFYRPHGISNFLDLDSLPEDEAITLVLGREHDSWAVYQYDVLIELNFLHDLGHARHVASWCCAAPLQRVDERALADVGEANDSHDDLLLGLSRLRALNARVVLQDVQEIL